LQLGFFVFCVVYAFVLAIRLLLKEFDDNAFVHYLRPWVLAVPQALLLLFVWKILKCRGETWEDIGVRSASTSLGYLAGFLCVPVNLIFSAICVYLTLEYGPEFAAIPNIPKDILGNGWFIVINLLTITVWVPAVEEIFFRGFMMRTMARKMSVPLAILGSSLVFSLAHGHVGLLVPIFISSVVLSTLYIKTNSLYPPILAHSIQNLVASVVAASS